MTAGQVRELSSSPPSLPGSEWTGPRRAAARRPRAGRAGMTPRYEAGALPLLSHAMLATWEHSHGETLTVSDYQASGGIKDALTQTAEQAYESLTDDQQDLARELFLRLVHVAEEMPPSRASVALGDLPGWDQEGRRRAGARHLRRRAHDHRGRGRGADHARRAARPPGPGCGPGSKQTRRTARPGQDRRRGTGLGGGRPRRTDALWRGSRLALAQEWAADAGKRAALPGQALSFVDACVAAAGDRRAARRRTRGCSPPSPCLPPWCSLSPGFPATPSASGQRPRR